MPPECEEVEIRGMLDNNEHIDRAVASKSPKLPAICGTSSPSITHLSVCEYFSYSRVPQIPRDIHTEKIKDTPSPITREILEFARDLRNSDAG